MQISGKSPGRGKLSLVELTFFSQPFIEIADKIGMPRIEVYQHILTSI
jgi:hypothetical protein